MADYRPSPWRPFYQKRDPIERCCCNQRNYRPFSRYSPHVDPRFYSYCYHRNDMPHMHDNRYTHHGVHQHPMTYGYSGFQVPEWSYLLP